MSEQSAVSASSGRSVFAVRDQLPPWQKLLFRAPLWAWRTGTAFLLPPSFAIITTRGRKSGTPRRTMVECTAYAGKYYILAARGEASDWVKNAQSDPNVTLQIRSINAPNHAIGGQGSRAGDEAGLRAAFQAFQRSPAWKPYLRQKGIAPESLEDFLAKRDRVYLMVISPQGEPTLPPQTVDLGWVWLPIGLGVIGLIMLSRR